VKQKQIELEQATKKLEELQQQKEKVEKAAAEAEANRQKQKQNEVSAKQQLGDDATKARQEAIAAVEKAEKLRKDKEQAEEEAKKKLDAANAAVLNSHPPVVAKAQTAPKNETKTSTEGLALSEDEAWIAAMSEKMVTKEHGALTYANV
jgi:DNA repair exonuclease SbcCD ATPase subunit